jgi:hypothetical protein
MKKYIVIKAFSLSRVLLLPFDIVYAENVGGPVFRLYNSKTRKTYGTMVEKEFNEVCELED